jgi:hypothetical protein
VDKERHACCAVLAARRPVAAVLADRGRSARKDDGERFARKWRGDVMMRDAVARVTRRIRVLLVCSCFLAIASDLPRGPRTIVLASDELGVLDNDHLRLEVDRAHGTIARIVDKPGEIQLAPVQELADSFRLVLRGADKTTKTIFGRDQRLSAFSERDNGFDLMWSGPLLDSDGRPHDILARMEVRLAGPALEFQLFVENHTECQVIQAWYPLIGGLSRFGRGPEVGEPCVMFPTSAPTIRKLAAPLDELTLAYPGQMNMSYSSVYNPRCNRALYFASHDTVARLKYYHVFAQPSPAGNEVFACIQHVPCTPPGQGFAGSPVVVRFHAGTWREAGPLYRDWFTRTFSLMDPARNWIRRQAFVQDTMFLLPEGTLNLTYHDIPRWAQDARDHGITAMLISGWHRGGHDNGYPHYEPDPRLGTYEDLRRALAECHSMGVRVYFFVNYQQAMIESQWFKDELHQYVEMREDGGYGACGWGMGTLWARMGNAKPMTWVDPSFPPYRDALLRHFLKLVEIGADGLHVDKMFPTPQNFNPRCTLSPDTSTWEGAIQLSRRLLDEARKVNPDFALSFECNWDRMLEFSNAIWWVGNMSFVRSVFPEMIETRAITSPYDYLGVNNAVRLSQVGLLGPLNYTRSVGWEPWRGLADYLCEVKRIQDELSDAVLYGQVLGHEGIELAAAPAECVDYNVFRSATTGRRVCVLTNSDLEQRTQVVQTFPGTTSRRVRVHAPLQAPVESELPVKLIIPGERIVFVEELPAASTQSGVNAARADERAPVPVVSSTTGELLNGGFESGDLAPWKADPNWCVDRNSCGAYQGWQGAAFAWSGGRGEAATGCLRSPPFVLTHDGVRLLMAGWNNGPGLQRSWNYVALKTADGAEIDRRGAPNSLVFTPVLLDGCGHAGETVFIEAVDEADQAGFSMFCIDDVRMVSLPPREAEPLPPLPPMAETSLTVLENDRYRVEADRAHGTITRIMDKPGNLELIREPRLAANFKFTLPLPGKEPWETIEANYILGQDQTLSSFDLDGQRLTLHWNAPLTSRTGERYDVSAIMGIELEHEAVRLTLQIDNRTPYQIGEVFFPILGGVSGLGNSRRELKLTQLVRPAAAGAVNSDTFFQFANMSGLGDQGPEQFLVYPRDLTEPWIELYGVQQHRSVYLGAHDPRGRSQVVHLEMLPGCAETPRMDGNWPRPEELQRQPAGVMLSFVEFANHAPDSVYNSAPVVLQAHDGSWPEGQRIYQTWKASR